MPAAENKFGWAAIHKHECRLECKEKLKKWSHSKICGGDTIGTQSGDVELIINTLNFREQICRFLGVQMMKYCGS